MNDAAGQERLERGRAIGVIRTSYAVRQLGTALARARGVSASSCATTCAELGRPCPRAWRRAPCRRPSPVDARLHPGDPLAPRQVRVDPLSCALVVRDLGREPLCRLLHLGDLGLLLRDPFLSAACLALASDSSSPERPGLVAGALSSPVTSGSSRMRVGRCRRTCRRRPGAHRVRPTRDSRTSGPGGTWRSAGTGGGSRRRHHRGELGSVGRCCRNGGHSTGRRSHPPVGSPSSTGHGRRTTPGSGSPG